MNQNLDIIFKVTKIFQTSNIPQLKRMLNNKITKTQERIERNHLLSYSFKRLQS